MKKRSFSLIEISIGLFLLSLILSAIFSSLHFSAKCIGKTQNLTEKEYAKTFFDMKISRIIESLAPAPSVGLVEYGNKEKGVFFIHTAQIHRKKALSGALTSVLYLNNKKQLCLATFKGEEKKCTAHEILFDRIESLDILFFDPKEKKWANSAPNVDMVKITLQYTKEKEKKEDFVYFLREKEMGGS